MLVPITLLVIALLVSVAIGVYTLKRRVANHDTPPDVRPDDPPPPSYVPPHVRGEDAYTNGRSGVPMR